MNKYTELLQQAVAQNKLVLHPEQTEKLIHYLALLQTWNRVFNLTTITDPRDMVYLHLIDSLLVQPFLHGNRMLDIGSGAGLPGIPLAIMNPAQEWFLLDKNNKKTRFLTQAAAELGLKNVSVAHNRGEDFHPNLCFDSILSRAFGTLRMFTETTKHLLCPNGILIAMKGKYPEEELADMPDNFIIQAITPVKIQGVTVDRHIVCLQAKNNEV